MFGYTGDDLAVFRILFTTGVALVVTGVAVAGWRHKALIWGFIVFGIAFCLCAFAWGSLKTAFPAVGPTLTDIAVNPQSWFTLFVWFVIALAFGRRNPRFSDPQSHATTNKLHALGEEALALD
jgi:hypothetical protein